MIARRKTSIPQLSPAPTPPPGPPRLLNTVLVQRVQEFGKELAEAQKIEEWNAVVSRLLGFLLETAADPELRADQEFHVWAGRLTFWIAQGVKPPAHGPRKNFQVRFDAMLIKGFQDQVKTIADGARLLMEWCPRDGVGGAPLQESAARKRVKRAAEYAGLTLEPGEPFGKRSGCTQSG